MNRTQQAALRKVSKTVNELANSEQVANVHLDWVGGIMYAKVTQHDGQRYDKVFDFPGIPQTMEELGEWGLELLKSLQVPA